jgi:predicted GNAT family N-acyltransferase
MNFKPQLLTDKSRLQEIYDLRVTAYEHSPKSVYVNRQTFPNGWSDDLDELDNTIHWIIEDENKIIASARLAILENIEDTNEEFDKFELPAERPFAYWSRLVVHPDYRRTTAMMMLDSIRKKYLFENTEIKFAISCVTEDRSKALLRIGFNYLGDFMYNWGGPEQVISAYLFTGT